MKPYRIHSISQYHQLRGLNGPSHPLISAFPIEEIGQLNEDEPEKIVQDFYSIAIKKDVNAIIRYGRNEYQSDYGTAYFIAPNQIYSLRAKLDLTHKGWLILIHPDFFYKTQLQSQIKEYQFFNYEVYEALNLTEKEEGLLIGLIKNIGTELNSNIDRFSKPLIISHIQTLLSYSDRYYDRQFLTQEKESYEILEKLELILDKHFHEDQLSKNGIPKVVDIANELNLSPNYLGSLLRVWTGKSTQEHIHDKLIALAKEKLSMASGTVSEIAYQLGFQYSQSFSKFFKNKTGVAPTAFRQSFI